MTVIEQSLEFKHWRRAVEQADVDWLSYRLQFWNEWANEVWDNRGLGRVWAVNRWLHWRAFEPK